MIEQRVDTAKLIVRTTILWFLVVLGLRLWMLSSTPFANGLDGYTYAVQILSLDRTGHLMIVDNSPVFFLMEGVNALLHDPVGTTKLCSAFFGALLGLAVRFFLLRAGATASQALLGMLLCGLSPTLTYLSVDYVKNLAAMVVFWLSAGWIVFLFSTDRKDWIDWTMGLGLFALTWTSHRMGAVLLAALVFFLSLQRWGRRPSFWCAVAGAAVLGGLLLSLPHGGLSLADWERFAPALSLQLALPALSKTFWEQLPVAVVIELTFAALLTWILVVRLRRGDHVFRALWLLSFLLFLPIWDLSVLDVGFRLFSNGVPLVIVTLVLAGPRIDTRWWAYGVLAGLCFLPVLKGVYRVERDPPYRLYQRVIESIDLPQDSLLIAHAGLNHLYTYTHNLKEAMNYLPDFSVSVDRLWRLSHGVLKAEYENVVPEAFANGRIRSLPGTYALVREDVFQVFLKRSSPERRQSLEDWFNPHTIRPEFLLQKNR